jgi:hypothetical protein
MVLQLSDDGDGIAASPVAIPYWNQDKRVLYVGQQIVKQYRVPSPNQEAILRAFEEEGWPHHIDDPLRIQAEHEPKCRLHFTIHRLNQSQKPRLVRFFGDGTGEGICWELAEVVTLTLPVDALPKKRLAA